MRQISKANIDEKHLTTIYLFVLFRELREGVTCENNLFVLKTKYVGHFRVKPHWPVKSLFLFSMCVLISLVPGGCNTNIAL